MILGFVRTSKINSNDGVFEHTYNLTISHFHNSIELTLIMHISFVQIDIALV